MEIEARMDSQGYQISEQQNNQISQNKIPLFLNIYQESFPTKFIAKTCLQTDLQALKQYFLSPKSDSNQKKYIKKAPKSKYGVPIPHLAKLVCELLDQRNKLLVTRILQMIRQKEVIWEALVSVYDKSNLIRDKQQESFNCKYFNERRRQKILKEESINLSSGNILMGPFPENSRSIKTKIFSEQQSQMRDQNEHPAKSIIIIQTKINKRKNINDNQQMKSERSVPIVKSKGGQFIQMIKDYVNRKINQDLVSNMEKVSVGFSNINSDQTSSTYYTQKMFDSIFNTKYHKKIQKFRQKINKSIILLPQA